MQSDKSKNVIIILLIVIIIILGTLVVLFATDTISLNAKISEDKQMVENDDSTGENSNLEDAESSQNSEETYYSIITEYKNAINDNEIESDYDLVSQKYPDVNERMISYFHMYKTQKFVYTFYDIDGNGSDELIISINNSNNYSIIDIFTYDGSSAVKQIADSCLGERCSVDIWDNGVFYYRGSGGANSGALEFSKIASNGYTNEIIQSFYYEYDDSNIVSFYSDIDKTNKLNYASVDEIEAIYLNKASIVSMESLNWNNFN